MQLYQRGIRRRLAPMLGGDQRRLEMAYSLMFTLPGTPVIRYGDEIGRGDDLSLPEREGARTAMQWSSAANGGFTLAKRSRVPVIADGPFGYAKVNVADQRRPPNSLLNWTERMIRMRKECPEIGWGTWQLLINQLREDHSRGERRGTYKLELPPYGYGWYRVGSLTDLQTREPR